MRQILSYDYFICLVAGQVNPQTIEELGGAGVGFFSWLNL